MADHADRSASARAPAKPRSGSEAFATFLPYARILSRLQALAIRATASPWRIGDLPVGNEMGRQIGQAALVCAAILMAAPAIADDGPRFCPTRPSIGGSSCTTEPGQVHVEYSLMDWERDDQPDQREDRIVAADFLTRLGVGKDTEVQLGWTAFGHDRTRDKTTGVVDTVNGTGDVTVAIRQHLTGAEGKPFSAGVQAFVSAPAGRYPVGSGTWAAGLIIPVQYDLTKTVAVSFTGEADAAADQSGDGRHLAYSGIGTLRYKLTDNVSTFAEISVKRDDDPAGQEP